MDLSALAQEHLERIFRAARAMTTDDHAAWDCVQETFATAMTARREPEGDPVAWLCGIARNHARHWQRGRERWRKAMARFAERRPRASTPADRTALRDALAQLPLKQRDAVVLRYLTGRTFREVAEAQGVTEAAAKARVRRGLAALRRGLGAAPLALLLVQEAEAGAGVLAAAATAGVAMKKWMIAVLAVVVALGAGLTLASRERPARRAPAAGLPEKRPDTGSSAPADAAAVAAGFVVRVVDATTGAAIPGARVTGARREGAPVARSGTSDARGEVFFAPFCGSFRASARGHVASRRTIMGTAGARVDLVLQRGAPVSGRVVWKGTDRGVAGAAVRATDAESYDVLDAVTTDAAGGFTLAGVRPDVPFVVEARRADLAPEGRLFWRTDGDVRLELGGGGVLTGRVLAPDGRPAAGATVRVRPVGSADQLLPARVPTYNTEYDATVTTGADGRFRLAGLRVPAAYELHARDADGAVGRAELAEFAQAGDAVHRELRLEARTTLAFEISYPDAEPRPSTSVSVWRDGRSVGPQGTASPRVLAKGGDYEVQVLAPNWPPVRVPVRVREGRWNVARVRMTRAGHAGVSGRVRTPSGRPVRDLPVRLGPRRTRTDADGWFHLFDLPAGGGRLVVSDDRGVFKSWSRESVRAGDGPFDVSLQAAARFVGRFVPPPARVRLHARYPHHRFERMQAIRTHPLAVDPGGRFEWPWSPGRRIAMTFEPARGAAVAFDEPPLRPGEVRDLGVLRIAPGFAAEGVVLDGDGEPVAHARVVVEIEDVFLDRVAYTDPAGRFRFDGLPHIPLAVAVTADDYVPQSRAFAGGDELHMHTIRLQAAGVWAGRLVRGGRPLAGEEFEAVPSAGGEPLPVGTDSVGRFRAQLPPGRYRPRFGEHRGAEVEIRARRTTQADFELE